MFDQAHPEPEMRLKKVSDYLVRIFEAPPGERSARDIHALLPILMMKTTCLRDVSKETVADILQKARLEKLNADDVIVRQGEVGETFYIILDGSVGIYLDTKKDEKMTVSLDNYTFPLPPPRRMSQISVSDKDGGEELPTDKHSDHLGPPSSKSIRRSSVTFAPRPESNKRQSSFTRSAKRDDKKIRKKYGSCVNTLGQYQCFGELALIYPNRKRNATAIAEVATQVLAISYEIFENTLQVTLERDLDEKRLFIQTHPFFSRWNYHLQRQLQWSLIRTTHRIGDHVIRQGEPLTGLHFLVSGRARLAAEPLKHRLQFPDFFIKPRENPFEKKDPSPVRREDTTLSEMAEAMRLSKSRRNILAGMDPMTYIRRTDGYAAAEKVVHEKFVDICIIEEGEVITDFELLLGLDKNMFSVICTSQCTFFHLDVKIFDRLIYRKSPHTLTMMKFLAETKLSRRNASQQGQRMAILTPLLLKILDVRVVDPTADDKTDDKFHLPTSKSVMLPRTPLMRKRPERSKTLIDWFIQGKTPLLQPINKDAIYYREMIQKRAKYRETARDRGPKEHREIKSLGRRIKDSYWFNMREKQKAVNTMKRLKLEHSEVTQAARWK